MYLYVLISQSQRLASFTYDDKPADLLKGTMPIVFCGLLCTHYETINFKSTADRRSRFDDSAEIFMLARDLCGFSIPSDQS